MAIDPGLHNSGLTNYNVPPTHRELPNVSNNNNNTSRNGNLQSANQTGPGSSSLIGQPNSNRSGGPGPNNQSATVNNNPNSQLSSPYPSNNNNPSAQNTSNNTGTPSRSVNTSYVQRGNNNPDNMSRSGAYYPNDKYSDNNGYNNNTNNNLPSSTNSNQHRSHQGGYTLGGGGQNDRGGPLTNGHLDNRNPHNNNHRDNNIIMNGRMVNGHHNQGHHREINNHSIGHNSQNNNGNNNNNGGGNNRMGSDHLNGRDNNNNLGLQNKNNGLGLMHNNNKYDNNNMAGSMTGSLSMHNNHNLNDHQNRVGQNGVKYDNRVRGANRKRRENCKNAKYHALRIDGRVKNLAPMLWNFTHLTKLVLRNNAIKMIPDKIGELKTLMMLDMSYNLIKTLPNSLGQLLELRDLNISNNKIKHLPNTLGRLFNLKSLAIEGNDIELTKFLKSNYNPSRMENAYLTEIILEKLYEEFIENKFFDHDHQIKLDYCIKTDADRCWEDRVSRAMRDQEKDISIYVMSYNILSDKYATKQQYGYCPEWALAWNHRQNYILNDIKSFGADLICLQEIEKIVYKNFKNNLSERSSFQTHGSTYGGLYSQKGRAKNMADHHQERVDGCAIFYADETLRGPIAQYTVEFTKEALAHLEDSKFKDQLASRMSTKDNIGLIVLFEYNAAKNKHAQRLNNFLPKHPPQYLIAVNAHLHWDPDYADVKIIQSVILANAIYKMRQAAVQPQEGLKYENPSFNVGKEGRKSDPEGLDINSLSSGSDNKSSPGDEKDEMGGESSMETHECSAHLGGVLSKKSRDECKSTSDNKPTNPFIDRNSPRFDSQDSSIKFFASNENLINTNPEDIPIIIGGDFNSLPDSGVHQFLLNGSVPINHEEFFKLDFPKDFTNLEQQESGLKVKLKEQASMGDAMNNNNNYDRNGKYKYQRNNNGESESSTDLAMSNLSPEEREKQRKPEYIINNNILHGLNLDTAYPNPEDMPFTNYTYEFKGIIDYIFYSKNSLQLGGYFKGLHPEWFEQREIPGCPFLTVPSDHLSLLAEFIFLNPREAKNQGQPQQNQASILNSQRSQSDPRKNDRADTSNMIRNLMNDSSIIRSSENNKDFSNHRGINPNIGEPHGNRMRDISRDNDMMGGQGRDYGMMGNFSSKYN